MLPERVEKTLILGDGKKARPLGLLLYSTSTGKVTVMLSRCTSEHPLPKGQLPLFELEIVSPAC